MAVALLLHPLPLLPPHQQPGAVAMHEATRHRDLEGMARLIEAQPQLLGCPDVVGRTPLMMACLRGHAEVAAWLLDQGAAPNGVDANHRTALYNAASYGFTEVVSLLLARGGDPSIGDVEGNTPLTAAAYYGYESVVRALLAFKGGRDPDDLQRQGTPRWSGLYLACESGHARIARIFLEAGADPTIADSRGFTPLDVARGNSNWRCARLLERALREPQRVALLRKARALTEASQGLALLEQHDALMVTAATGNGVTPPPPSLLLSPSPSACSSSSSLSSSSSSSTMPATPPRTRHGKRQRSLQLTPPYLKRRVAAGRPLPVVRIGERDCLPLLPPLPLPPPASPEQQQTQGGGGGGSRRRAGGKLSPQQPQQQLLPPPPQQQQQQQQQQPRRRRLSSHGGAKGGKVPRYCPQAHHQHQHQHSAAPTTTAATTTTRGVDAAVGCSPGAGATVLAPHSFSFKVEPAPAPAAPEVEPEPEPEPEPPVAVGVARAVVGGALPPELFRELCELMRVRWDPCGGLGAGGEGGQGRQGRQQQAR